MAKFKVIALSVGGKYKKIYESGDVVDGGMFDDSAALVKQGFLEEIEEKKPEVKAETEPEAPKKTASKRK